MIMKMRADSFVIYRHLSLGSIGVVQHNNSTGIFTTLCFSHADSHWHDFFSRLLLKKPQRAEKEEEIRS